MKSIEVAPHGAVGFSFGWFSRTSSLEQCLKQSCSQRCQPLLSLLLQLLLLCRVLREEHPEGRRRALPPVRASSRGAQMPLKASVRPENTPDLPPHPHPCPVFSFRAQCVYFTGGAGPTLERIATRCFP